MREKVTHTIYSVNAVVLPAEPRPAVTFGTDAAGLFGAIAPKVSERFHLGPVTAAVSISNDRGIDNILNNVVGLLPDADVPMAVNGAMIDGFNALTFDRTLAGEGGNGKFGDAMYKSENENVIPTKVSDGNVTVNNDDLDPCGGWCQ